MALSSYGKWLATCGGFPLSPNPTVTVWDAETGARLFAFLGHAMSAVQTVVFNHNDSRLASSGWDGTVRVWDVTSRPDARRLPFDSDIMQLALNFKGYQLAVAISNSERTNTSSAPGFEIWDALAGLKQHSIEGSGMCVAYSPDGQRIACGSGAWDAISKTYVAGEVTVRNGVTGEVLQIYKGHTGSVFDVVFSPDGKRLASLARVTSGESATAPAFSGESKLWDTQSGKQLRTIQGGGRFVSFNPDGKYVASGNGVAFSAHDGNLKLWDVETGEEFLSLKGHWGGRITFNPDGRLLAHAAVNNSVKVLEYPSGQETLTLHGHSQPVTSVTFSPSGKRLATVSLDGTVKLWDAVSGQQVYTYEVKGDLRNSTVAFSKDGDVLICNSARMITLWDATSSI